MKKALYWAVRVIIGVVIIVAVAGVYRFNFTNDDIYVQTSTGKVLQYDEAVKNSIYTSFYPLYFLTKGVVGDTYEVVNLIPTGGESHEFEPSPRQIEDILKSHFVVMNGLGMEHYEEKLSAELEKNKVGFVHLSEKLTNVISTEKNEEEHHEEE